MNHLGPKGFKELKCGVARAEEKLNDLGLSAAWRWIRRECPGAVGVRIYMEAAPGLSWLQNKPLPIPGSPWAPHTSWGFGECFLPSLSIRRSKPKGTSVWAHQETNLVSISDPSESSATEGFQRDDQQEAAADKWSFPSIFSPTLQAHLDFSLSCKHLDNANGETKIGSYINAFLTKRFFISVPECFWISPFSWVIPRETFQWCSSGSLKYHKYPIQGTGYSHRDNNFFSDPLKSDTSLLSVPKLGF